MTLDNPSLPAWVFIGEKIYEVKVEGFSESFLDLERDAIAAILSLEDIIHHLKNATLHKPDLSTINRVYGKGGLPIE